MPCLLHSAKRFRRPRVASAATTRPRRRAGGESWSYRDEDGTLAGPEGHAAGPRGHLCAWGQGSLSVSSLIMNADAGARGRACSEIIMVVPTPVRGSVATGGSGAATATRGERNDLVLAAAYVAGVTRAFTMGGAQAVAALAYGTATVPKVDKITGPGNAYVASAKKRVFGTVGIDMIAGPSEILVLGRRQHACGMGRNGPLQPGRARRAGAKHSAVPRRRLYRRRATPKSIACCRPCRAQPSSPSSLNDRGALIHTRRHGRGLRHQQPHCARAPGGLQQRAAPLGAAAASTRGRSFWARTPARAWVTTAPGPTMSCPPAALRVFRPRWACTTSRSAAA